MAEVIEIKMLVLLHEFEGRLPTKVYKEIESLAVHREWGIALENLCEQLYEFNLPIESEALGKIKELTELMQLSSERTWRSLVKE
jgi:hypothetical protein